MGLLDFLKNIEPDKKKRPIMHTLYDAVFTLAYSPNKVTKGGVHIRDGMDLKRTMIQVVFAMSLCYLLGTYNTGHQHFVAMGMYPGILEGFGLKLVYGIVKLLPIGWSILPFAGTGVPNGIISSLVRIVPVV